MDVQALFSLALSDPNRVINGEQYNAHIEDLSAKWGSKEAAESFMKANYMMKHDFYPAYVNYGYLRDDLNSVVSMKDGPAKVEAMVRIQSLVNNLTPDVRNKISWQHVQSLLEAQELIATNAEVKTVQAQAPEVVYDPAGDPCIRLGNKDYRINGAESKGNLLLQQGADIVYTDGVPYAVDPNATDKDHKYYYASKAEPYGDYLYRKYGKKFLFTTPPVIRMQERKEKKLIIMYVRRQDKTSHLHRVTMKVRKLRPKKI
jgi:hypothetical protein